VSTYCAPPLSVVATVTTSEPSDWVHTPAVPSAPDVDVTARAASSAVLLLASPETVTRDPASMSQLGASVTVSVLDPDTKGWLCRTDRSVNSGTNTSRGVDPAATPRLLVGVGVVVTICAVLILPLALIDIEGALCAAAGFWTSKEKT